MSGKIFRPVHPSRAVSRNIPRRSRQFLTWPAQILARPRRRVAARHPGRTAVTSCDARTAGGRRTGGARSPGRPGETYPTAGTTVAPQGAPSVAGQADQYACRPRTLRRPPGHGPGADRRRRAPAGRTAGPGRHRGRPAAVPRARRPRRAHRGARLRPARRRPGPDAARSGRPPGAAPAAPRGRPAAHAERRSFPRKVFFASGATAVAPMGGAGARSAPARESTGTAIADASAAQRVPGRRGGRRTRRPDRHRVLLRPDHRRQADRRPVHGPLRQVRHRPRHHGRRGIPLPRRPHRPPEGARHRPAPDRAERRRAGDDGARPPDQPGGRRGDRPDRPLPRGRLLLDGPRPPVGHRTPGLPVRRPPPRRRLLHRWAARSS
jgi:hypothetical protein